MTTVSLLWPFHLAGAKSNWLRRVKLIYHRAPEILIIFIKFNVKKIIVSLSSRSRKLFLSFTLLKEFSTLELANSDSSFKITFTLSMASFVFIWDPKSWNISFKKESLQCSKALSNSGRYYLSIKCKAELRLWPSG